LSYATTGLYKWSLRGLQGCAEQTVITQSNGAVDTVYASSTQTLSLQDLCIANTGSGEVAGNRSVENEGRGEYLRCIFDGKGGASVQNGGQVDDCQFRGAEYGLVAIGDVVISDSRFSVSGWGVCNATCLFATGRLAVTRCVFDASSVTVTSNPEEQFYVNAVNIESASAFTPCVAVIDSCAMNVAALGAGTNANGVAAVTDVVDTANVQVTVTNSAIRTTCASGVARDLATFSGATYGIGGTATISVADTDYDSAKTGGNITLMAVGSISGVTFPTNFALLSISAGGVVRALTDTGAKLPTATELQAIPGQILATVIDGETVTERLAHLDADVSAIEAGSAPTADEVADAVWDEALSGHPGVGTAGAALSAAGSAGDPWSTALPGSYADTTAGYIIGTLIETLPDAASLAATGVTVYSAVEGYDVTIYQGDSHETSTGREIDFVKPSGAEWPSTLSGWTVTFRLVAVASGATTTTITGSVVTPTGDSQTVRMVLTHAQTQALTALDNGNHAYRLLILANNGTTNYATLGEGKLYVRTGWSS